MKDDGFDLRRFFDDALELLCIADTEGRFRLLNPAFERTLGYTLEELTSRPFLDFVHPDDRAATLREMERLSQGTATIRFENRYRCKDGSYRWLEWSTAPADAQGWLYAAARDVTKQRESERALEDKSHQLQALAWQKETENRILALFSSSHEKGAILDGVLSLLAERQSFPVSALYLYDEWTGRLTCASRQAAPAQLPESLEPGEGLVGQVAVDLHLRVLRREEVALPLTLQAGLVEVQPEAVALVPVSYQGKLQGVMALASTRPLQASEEDFLSRLGVQLGVALNNLDQYQELRLLSEQLQRRGEEIGRKNQELQRADRLKSEFLANMSHELRTPLNSILGFSDILRDGIMGDLTEDQREQVDHIHQSGQHLLALINDILDLSKIEAGQMDIALEPVLLADLLRRGLAVVKERANRHGIRLEWSVAPDLSEVWVDQRKVKHILFNLLTNAVKFTPDGGRVWVEAVRCEPAGWFEIRVGDTGIGIAREDLPRLFQPFQQLDSRLSRRYEGTGLGLVMVRRLAELHGGTVEVDSEPGRGSVFTVRMPGGAEPASAAAAPAAEPARESPVLPDGAGQLILVVEDEDRDWFLLRRLLEHAGFRAMRARDGREGLRMLQDHRPDLVVLDLVMPELDGFAFLEEKVRSPHLGEVPVLVVTQFIEEVGRASFAIQGALTKPVHREGFLEAVRSLVPPQPDRSPQILLVDDDPRASRLMSAHLAGSPYALISAFNGTQGLEFAERYRPDLIVLDLMMPDLSGLEVAEELRRRDSTRHIPILILTGKRLSDQERARLTTIAQEVAEKSGLREAELLARIRSMLAGSP